MPDVVNNLDADYIVIGAGSAGCVVASRLSEDPSCRVVLIEAGPKDGFFWIRVPIGYAPRLEDKRFNWRYETEPEPFLGGRRISWPRGKVLGGSSSINGLIYIRGQGADYDHWRQLGNDGWSFDDVLPYFKRAEDQCRGADDYHGAGGPLCVSDRPDRHPICEAFIASAMALGIPHNPDFNRESQEGVGYYQLTTCKGRRCSTAVGYLRPAVKRHNLRVVTQALTRRILFEGRRTVGVEYTSGGERVRLRCTREVILTAGAINSPQLLLLSGIGPAEELRDKGIAVVADRSGVGKNLQDHYQTRIAYRCRYPITVNDLLRSPLKKLRYGAQYLAFRTGPVVGIATSAVGLFTRTLPELETPDIQFHLLVFSSDRRVGGLHKFPGFMQNVCQSRPESRGAITLKTPNPADPPAIRANYLSEEIDRRTLIAGLRLARRIAAEQALQRFIEFEYLPGERVRTDEDWLSYAKEYAGTIFHPVGTCKMGPDPMAVVDAQLRVRGVTGLRVADASIMPTLISGNTNAAAIMIGEKAADLVRHEAVVATAA
jgi:choline dehydrogenase